MKKGVKRKKTFRFSFKQLRVCLRHCMTEMFTGESYTQVFLFILRTFCGNLEHFNRLRYLGYDRACGLVPFFKKNRAQNGSAGAKVLLDNVQFLVDIFHVSKHTEEV